MLRIDVKNRCSVVFNFSQMHPSIEYKVIIYLVYVCINSLQLSENVIFLLINIIISLSSGRERGNHAPFHILFPMHYNTLYHTTPRCTTLHHATPHYNSLHHTPHTLHTSHHIPRTLYTHHTAHHTHHTHHTPHYSLHHTTPHYSIVP